MSRPPTVTLYETLPDGEVRISVRMFCQGQELVALQDLLRADICRSLSKAVDRELERVLLGHGLVKPIGIVNLEDVRRGKKP